MVGSLAGRVLERRWTLEGRVASGSFASVYRATDAETGGVVAVKVLTEVDNAEAEARFRAEYDTLRRFDHPYIVRGHAVGVVDGRPYMVLDFVPGGNVLSLLEDGPLAVGRAACIGCQVLAALAEAHARGVIHRDVKPGNVLVGDDGSVRLCDFGIARVDGGKAGLTQAGSSLGTLLYMAPEQRLDAHNVDLTADLYSVACLLYRLVTDESPSDLFTIGADHPRWAAVPEALRPVLQRATQPLPGDRYADARDMALALLPLADPEARDRLIRSCDPWKFPIPDPGVRVGAHAEEPTAPDQRPRPVSAARKSAAPAAKVAKEANPWPWRIGVAVLVVVVMMLATMAL